MNKVGGQLTTMPCFNRYSSGVSNMDAPPLKFNVMEGNDSSRLQLRDSKRRQHVVIQVRVLERQRSTAVCWKNLPEVTKHSFPLPVAIERTDDETEASIYE